MGYLLCVTFHVATALQLLNALRIWITDISAFLREQPTATPSIRRVAGSAADWKSHHLRGQIHCGIQVRRDGECGSIMILP